MRQLSGVVLSGSPVLWRLLCRLMKIWVRTVFFASSLLSFTMSFRLASGCSPRKLQQETMVLFAHVLHPLRTLSASIGTSDIIF